MNILITGISGLLGTLVASEAHRFGYIVYGVHRRTSKMHFDFPVHLRLQDLKDEVYDSNLLTDIDVVVHCAADTKMGSFFNLNQEAMNVLAVQKLVDASINAGVKKFILISSANTLKPGTAANPGNEKEAYDLERRHLNYINTKIKAERIVKRAAKNHSLDGVIVNPTFMLNPHFGNSSTNQLVYYALNMPVLFHSPGGKNVVDARDVAKAIVVAIDKGRSGENYLLCNENYTFKAFFEMVLKETGRKGRFVGMPPLLLRPAAYITTAVEWLIKRPINFNLKTAKLLNENHVYSHAKASAELGFNPRSIKDTIQTKIKNLNHELPHTAG